MSRVPSPPNLSELSHRARAQSRTAGAGVPAGVSLPFPMPANCANIDMRIDNDGLWWHDNSPIGRLPLARLFASVLHRDAKGQHWLITPAELAEVHVARTAYVLVDYQIRRNATGGDTYVFRSSLDEEFVPSAGEIEYVPSGHAAAGVGAMELLPAIVVRHRVLARVGRNIFYALVAEALAASPPRLHNDTPYFVSDGIEYLLAPTK